MQFYQVSSDWIYSPVLNRIENRYGLAGIGFYWKVVCVLFLAGRPLPLINLLAMRGKGLRWGEANEILQISTQIFIRNENGDFLLVDNTIATGVIKPEGSHPEVQKLFASRARTEAGMEARTDTRTKAGTDTGTEARTDVGTEAGSVPVLVDSLDNNRIEEMRQEQAAEESFEIFLQNECPHLFQFEEPITFDELKELREFYSIEDIRSVLVDMNDRPGLPQTSRSCAKTARRWLEARERKRERRGI